MKLLKRRTRRTKQVKCAWCDTVIPTGQAVLYGPYRCCSEEHVQEMICFLAW